MRWRVLLDAAKLASSPGALDLAGCPADFVAVSFYKIFGRPFFLCALCRGGLEWSAGVSGEAICIQKCFASPSLRSANRLPFRSVSSRAPQALAEHMLLDRARSLSLSLSGSRCFSCRCSSTKKCPQTSD